MKNLRSFIPFVLFVSLVAFVLCGCKTGKLEQGGAYAPVTTNAAGQVLAVTAPEQALYVADAAFKLAYDTVFGVMKFERDNRVTIQAISPKIKTELDKIRPQVVDVDQRWARARQAYKLNPTPANLTVIQLIIAEIQRLVPVVQTQIAPVYTSITSTNTP
jgi:hypothetical protein